MGNQGRGDRNSLKAWKKTKSAQSKQDTGPNPILARGERVGDRTGRTKVVITSFLPPLPRRATDAQGRWSTSFLRSF